MTPTIRRAVYVTTIALAGIAAAPAYAVPFTIMFERNTDVATNELAFRTYASLADMVANQPSVPDQFSAINIASTFDTSGLTWDGTQFIMMFERNTDVATNEVAFRTYGSLADLVANQPSVPDQFSAINIAAGFDTSGLTWDGIQFMMMFERNTDVATNELAFRTYATLTDLVANQPSAPDQFSAINIAAGFDTSGLTWDGTQFVMMFERNTDVATNELAFRTYATLADLVANQPSAPDQFSAINIASTFDTSGLMALWKPGGGGNGGTSVPEPAALGLLGLGLAGLVLVQRRPRRST